MMIVGVCILLVVMPVGLSDCGCDTSSQPQLSEEIPSGTGLSSADIALLQEQAGQERWSFTVGENSATAYPLEQLCGLVEPENWQDTAAFDPCLPTRELPERFDWRDVNGTDYTTPVKNQGGCGSCWAFGTVGPLECNIKIHDGDTVDISEQYLVSCNSDGWGCQGGWWAHNYHEFKPDPCGDVGALLEAEFPYVARNVPCQCPYVHTYLIYDWKFIGSQYNIPSVESIKQAILDYGPVSVAIYVDNGFQAYNGGVFNSTAQGDINHAPVLVGWDDHYYWNGNYYGVWFLRNSWGTGWGEAGYMNIVYGCNEVGYAACYVDYRGQKIPPKTTLDIGVKGGVGLTVHVTNIGPADALNVNWTISTKGGFFKLLNLSAKGNRSVLQAQAIEAASLLPFGFGFIEVEVTATASNAPTVTKTANMILLSGRFVWYCLDCYC